MLSDQNKAKLKLLLESVPHKVRLEIMMHIQMALARLLKFKNAEFTAVVGYFGQVYRS